MKKTALLIIFAAASMQAATIIEQWDAGFAPGEYFIDVTATNGDTDDNGPAAYSFWLDTGIFQVLEQQETMGVIQSFAFDLCPSNADCILQDTIPATLNPPIIYSPVDPPTATPEPTTLAMFLVGGVLIIGNRGRMRRR